MSRSDNVYVVEKRTMSGSMLIAAFTVKHELATWLYQRYDKDVVVTRMEDGPFGGDASKTSEMDTGQLLQQGYLQEWWKWDRRQEEFKGEEPREWMP